MAFVETQLKLQPQLIETSFLNEDFLFRRQINELHREMSGRGLAGQYKLLHTGFNIALQMNRLKKGEPIYDWSKKVAPDIKSFVLEYLRGKAFLPFKNSLKFVDGTWRLVSKDYGKSRPLADLIDPSERGGAVRKSIEDLEQFFIHAPIGAIAIRTSPPGPSRLYTADGKEICYEDTQTQIMIKENEGVIRGHTIRTDKNAMDLEKNKQFLEELGLSFDPDFDNKSQKERLAIISGANVFVSPNSDVSVLDIIKKLQAVSGDRGFGGISFASIINDVGRFDELLKVDSWTKQYIDRFLRFAQTANIEQIEQALAVTILELMMAHEHVKQINRTSVVDYRRFNTVGFDSFRIGSAAVFSTLLDKLQTLPGCAGGGIKTKDPFSQTTTVDTPFGPREVSLSDKDSGLCKCGNPSNPHFHCPGKDEKKNEPCNHPIIVGAGTTKCPSCGLEATCK
jgi:hypothetical protein